jgi:hypothetical protein
MKWLGEVRRSAREFTGLVGLLSALVGCERHAVPARDALAAAVSNRPSAAAGPTANSRSRSVGSGDVPANGLGILIVPTAEATTKTLKFKFCYHGDSSYDPEIWEIVIGNAAGVRCQISADGDAWLWKEWTMGTVPKGFRANGCESLPQGDYEVMVSAVFGSGQVRIAIDRGGDVRRLPWDKLSSTPREECPDRGTASPRLIRAKHDAAEAR